MSSRRELFALFISLNILHLLENLVKPELIIVYQHDINSD